jgi:cytochrome c5
MSSESSEKETFRGLLMLVGGMAGTVIIAVIAAISISPHKNVVVDEAAVDQRIAPVGQVTIAAATGGAGVVRTGEQLYQAACTACHATGAAGAPKLGDNAAWAPRLAQGLSGLLKSVTNGKNAMPPKGGADASELELARAIVYMANKSGGSLKEPAAPAEK